MRNVLVTVLSFSLFYSLAYGNDPAKSIFQRSPGKVDCNEEVRICSYVAQNITARDLVAKLNANLFPGSILSPSEGYIVTDGLKKINFYINNEELRLKFIAAIPLMDALEDFDPSDLVLLTTEIFSLTEGGLSNMQASLVNTNETTSELADWIITSAFGGPTGMALKVGTNLLSSLLGSGKIKEESSKLTTISQLIPNLAGINYSKTSKIYISPPGSGVVKEEQSGLSVDGTVSISARDNDLVLIKDFHLTYGVTENATAGERVNILNISNPQLYLVRGMSSLVVSSVTLDQMSKTEYSAVSMGRKKDKKMDKIMIVTRAESIKFDDFISDMKKMRQFEMHQVFSAEEKAKFLKSDIKIEDVLNNINAHAFFTTAGDRVLGFKLNPKDARLNNIKKNIEVKIKTRGGLMSKGINQKTVLSVENLMLTGVKFDSLKASDLKKAIVEIDVTMKVFGSSESITKTLLYNTETNKFLE